MIISYDFGISLNEYAARGKGNIFPLFDNCPNCNCPSPGNLYRHGYYWRFGVSEETSIRIPICRMKCQSCCVSFSILPDFLAPYFQHTLHIILKRIQEFLALKKVNGSRQLLSFHLNRYMKKLKWIHTFFLSIGEFSSFSGDIRKEAIKYMKRILDFGESSFLRRSWGHLSSYFMAN